MQLPSTTFIAGRKTVSDWLLMKKELTDFKNDIIWEKAYDDYFLTRLKDRYLTPIDSIKENGGYTGEGFSIMTIICSLIEFLERDNSRRFTKLLIHDGISLIELLERYNLQRFTKLLIHDSISLIELLESYNS